MNSQTESVKRDTQEMSKSPLSELLGDKRHLYNLIAMCAVWTSGSFGYNLIGFQTKYIQGNFYINNISSACSEMLSYLIVGLMFHNLGLKTTIYISTIISTLGMVCLALATTSNQALISCFILCSKFGAS